MEIIQKLFSDPIWNGIQGVITILTFLFLLREKKDELIPYLKKIFPVINEFIKAVVLISFAWLFSYFFFYVFLDLLVVVAKGVFAPPIKFDNFVYQVFSFPPNYLKYILPSALAAISATDKKLSEKRAVFVGLIVSGYTYSYLTITGEFSGLFKIVEITQNPKLIDFIAMGIFGFAFIVSVVLCTLLLGNVTGRLCTKGVYVGRIFIEKSNHYFKSVILKVITSYIKIVKDYWAK